ncbi:MAG: hypothetical protein ACREBC_09980 [Pyrinomonadaceae bacterium]
MLTESFLSIANASRQLWRNRSAMILLASIYAALIASLYVFVTIREASVGQVALTLALAIAAPILFFLLQTAIARLSSIDFGLCIQDTQPRLKSVPLNSPAFRELIKESIRNCWKVVIVSVPLIAVGILSFYLLAKAQNYFVADAEGLSQVAQQYSVDQDANLTQSVQWNVVAFTAIRYVLLGALLPLAMIHIWIATVHEGLLSMVRKIKDLIARAYSPQSVLIYMVGFLIFGVIPYLLVFKAIPTSRPWLEFSLFLARLAVVFVMTLFGWVLTMNALANSARQAQGNASF